MYQMKDDLMVTFLGLPKKQQEAYIALFVEHSRKQRICVILTLQDVFPQSLAIRTMIKNATHIIVFPFYSDMLGLSRFFSKLFARKSKLAMECLNHSNMVKESFCGYLLCITEPQNKQLLIRVRNFIAPVTDSTDNDTLFPRDSLYVYPYF